MGDSAIARAVRTFAALMVGPLTAAAAVNWFGGDAKLGATKLTLAIIAAAVAAVGAWALAKSAVAPATPLGRALATFLEGVTAGLATVALADLSNTAAVQFAQQIGAILLSSGLAAITTLAMAASGSGTTTRTVVESGE